jgi:CHAT domain-containing protein
LTITRLSGARYSGELAFLSACRTAAGGVDLPDEVITLAAALNYTGYRHVVATLWSVDPAIAADVTTAVYTEMITGTGLDPDRSATALHQAVRALRDAGRPLDEWLPFTHTGP